VAFAERNAQLANLTETSANPTQRDASRALGQQGITLPTLLFYLKRAANKRTDASLLARKLISK